MILFGELSTETTYSVAHFALFIGFIQSFMDRFWLVSRVIAHAGLKLVGQKLFASIALTVLPQGNVVSWYGRRFYLLPTTIRELPNGRGRTPNIFCSRHESRYARSLSQRDGTLGTCGSVWRNCSLRCIRNLRGKVQ